MKEITITREATGIQYDYRKLYVNSNPWKSGLGILSTYRPILIGVATDVRKIYWNIMLMDDNI